MNQMTKKIKCITSLHSLQLHREFSNAVINKLWKVMRTQKDSVVSLIILVFVLIYTTQAYSQSLSL